MHKKAVNWQVSTQTKEKTQHMMEKQKQPFKMSVMAKKWTPLLNTLIGEDYDGQYTGLIVHKNADDPEPALLQKGWSAQLQEIFSTAFLWTHTIRCLSSICL